MSIQLRLNLSIAAVVALALASIIATTILNAAPRIRAENESIMRLSKEFVETAIDSLKGMREPAQGLENLVAGLKGLRHVEIVLVPSGASQSPTESPARGAEAVPAWFVDLIRPPGMSERLPVNVDKRNYGQIIISTKSSDEIREIWDSTIELLINGVLLASFTIALASLIVRKAVSPVHQLGEALSKMEEGNYEVRVPAAGPPEIAAIGSKLNSLATALERERDRNQRLTERIVGIQDAERKELAHELHDELGPHLFAIRAGATAVHQESLKPAPDIGRLAEGSATLLEQIEIIQRSNRRVLERLRPVALAEFGLVAAIEHLAAGWRKERPGVQLSCKASEASGLSETVELTIYRLVQEALTNAFRHSGASRIEVEMGPAAGFDESIRRRLGKLAEEKILVSVRDNGAGMGSSGKQSFGLMGMRERVAVVGGTLHIHERHGGGVEIMAAIPAIAGAGRSAATGM